MACQRIRLSVSGMCPELRSNEQLPFFNALGAIQLEQAYGGATGGRGP